MSDLQPWTVEWVDPIHSLPAALMVAVALYRVSAFGEGGAARSLWLALLALVGGSVVNIAPLHQWLLEVGGPAGQAVAVEVFTVLAAAFVLALIAQTTGVGCTRRLGVITVMALLAMSVPLLVLRPASLTDGPTDGPGGLPASASAADVAAWGVHWVVVLGLLNLGVRLYIGTPSDQAAAQAVEQVAQQRPELLQGKQWIDGSDCMRCHGVERKFVGPGFVQVAERYRGQADAASYLGGKIREGRVGVWGHVLMPQHPRVTQAQAEAMAGWILALPPTAP